MDASKDHGGEPAAKDLGVLLFLVAACPFGLLMWVALFSTIRWSVLAILGVAVGLLPHPVSIATGPAIPALAPVAASQPWWVLLPDPYLGRPKVRVKPP
jgi:hypothetical protein